MKIKIQNNNDLENRKSEAGFTLVEMVIVVTIITILSTFALFSLTAKKMNEAETRTLQIIDILQEARQRALSQRTTMRVELNASLRAVRLIDERTPTVATDDVIIKTAVFNDEVTLIGTKPTNVTGQPTELTPVPVPTFSSSNHPLSNGNSVIVLRFTRRGTVENAGSNAVGNGATPTGATIYVWSKYPNDNSATPVKAQVMRAVTVLGGSGSIRMWKCLFTNEACSTWTK